MCLRRLKVEELRSVPDESMSSPDAASAKIGHDEFYHVL